MNPFRQFLQLLRGASQPSAESSVARLWRTAVFWSWILHILRLGSLLVVAPLLTRLPGSDFGFYYLLLNIVAVTPLIDFGFAASVERSVSYAMGGAKKLNAHGLPEAGNGDGSPNFELLWKLVHTARLFYRLLTVLLLALLGGVGTYIVYGSAPETSNPTLAWLTWGIAFLNAGFEVYSSWWNVVLRGMNQVVAGSRILCLGQALKLVLSCVLLFSGAGVMSVFAAGLFSSTVVRALSRHYVKRALPAQPTERPARAEFLALLRMLWPNSWRVGLQLIGIYVTSLLLMLICKRHFGLSGAGQYGFSINIAVLIQGMASVWVSVKWPLIGQLRSKNDIPGMQRVLWSRIWLETGTYILLAILALIFTPILLKFGVIQKDVLPPPWFLVLLINNFFETQAIIWGTFLSTENKVPTLWPTMIANLLAVVLVWFLVRETQLGLGAFAIAPLILGGLFNYWYWPRAGARNLQSSWFAYMFRRKAV